MACPNVNFNVYVNQCFGWFRRSRRWHQTSIKIGPWGGAGARSFDTGGFASRIKRVRLRTGLVVDSLQISYDIDPNINVQTGQLGGQGGTLYEFTLQPNEYINSMVGSVNDLNGETCIVRLTFTSNLGNTYGPFGGVGGQEFSVSIIDGRIVGFFCQYGEYLNQIGVYLARN